MHDQLFSELNKAVRNTIVNDFSYNGLCSGMSGILLYNRYYCYYNHGADFLSAKEFDEFVGKIISNLSEFPTFANGLSGDLWVLNNLFKNNLIQIDSKELSYLNNFISSELINLCVNDKWDNLHGSFGLLYFLLDIKALTFENLNTFLTHLKNKLYRNGKFVFYEVRSVSDKPETSINLSLSHGISGHILILTKAMSQFQGNELGMSILKDMVDFLIGFMTDKPQTGFFPQTIYKNRNIDYEHVRLGWCYGDLGPGLALLRYSDLIKNPALKQKAIEILSFSAKRKGMFDCKVFDANLCHGTSGIMHIYHRLYKETGIKEFQESSEYWLTTSLKLFTEKNINGFASRKIEEDGTSRMELTSSLLMGLSGIGIALMSKLNDDDMPKWDGFLFLN